mmetsp:Transcript_21128/g.56049  ORF Transcript_21128/g.56049 Transcript_21128/m.56049 type:complete len:251 (-) Transcript_21128:49-801(-)
MRRMVEQNVEPLHVSNKDVFNGPWLAVLRLLLPVRADEVVECPITGPVVRPGGVTPLPLHKCQHARRYEQPFVCHLSQFDRVPILALFLIHAREIVLLAVGQLAHRFEAMAAIHVKRVARILGRIAQLHPHHSVDRCCVQVAATIRDVEYDYECKYQAQQEVPQQRQLDVVHPDDLRGGEHEDFLAQTVHGEAHVAEERHAEGEDRRCGPAPAACRRPGGRGRGRPPWSSAQPDGGAGRGDYRPSSQAGS